MSNFASESRNQRWLKYGGNVLLTSLIVVALAVLFTFGAERHPIRFDATASGMYSLKPQTLRIIHDIKSPITLISLYTRTTPPTDTTGDNSDTAKPSIPPAEAAQTVDDLLQEYAAKGSNITFESIDPVTSPAKVDELISQVEDKYGGQVKQYADYVKSVPGTIKQINDIANTLVQKLQDLQIPQGDPDLITTMQQVYLTVEGVPSDLRSLNDNVQAALREKPPDYKGTTDHVRSDLEAMSSLIDTVVKNFDILKKRGSLPPAISQYMDESLPQYEQLKKLVDDSLAQAKGLGELKLDTLRTALKDRNTILVMGQGDDGWRVLQYDEVWKQPGRMATSGDEANPRPRFAGEQAVTAAILSVSRKGMPKPKVCFVRSGGNPLLQPDFEGAMDLSEMAYRLGLYDYDVTEKDFSDTGEGNPDAPPEPSDDEIKDALWVVWDFGPEQQNPDMPAPAPLAPHLAEHLKEGGSAIIITEYHQDAMTDTLAPWGVTIRSDAAVIHEKIPAPPGESSDVVDQVLRRPPAFELHEFGDAPLAAPLNGLEGFFFLMSPVTVNKQDGYTASSLLPIPTAPDAPLSWGETDSTQLSNDDSSPTYNPKTDIAGPLYAGAAVENPSGARLVVLAGGPFMLTAYADITAKRLDPNAPDVARFPANGELFTNAVFWASHQDTLIDISPAAMDIGRIRDISPGWLTFWRLGILLIGLPGAVLVLAIGVYLRRMD